MYPRIRLMLAAAMVLVLCRGAADQGEATVVRNAKTAPVNPAVESGGHPLQVKGRDGPPPVVFPYSLISAWRPEYPWFPSCCAWPWSAFSSFNRDRHGGRGPPIGIPSGDGSIIRLRPPVP